MKNNYSIKVPAKDARNGNLGSLYTADCAAWIWHPEKCNMVEFELEWEQENAQEVVCFVSADNRFELYLDDEYIAMGPDRCDVAHWAFSALKLQFSPGTHRLRAHCWHYSHESGIMPLAQLTYRAGFLFGVEDETLRPVFNTGSAQWRVRALNGVSFEPVCRWIGSATITDMNAFSSPAPWVAAEIVDAAREGNRWGAIENFRRLYPSELPEQMRILWDGKAKVRAVWEGFEGNIIQIPQQCNAAPEWQAFFNNTSSITVPADSRVAVVADFEDYLCAYPELTVAGGGEDCTIELCWQESFYEDANDAPLWNVKPSRDVICGKYFLRSKNHQRDTFRNIPETECRCKPFWWRAGRYILLLIRTGNTPVTLKNLRFFECRYPAEKESDITFDRQELSDIQPMMIRAMQSCMHETFMDCPYFEQLMYVGDGRLECLTAYVLMQDNALCKRAIHLLDWSRPFWNGLVAERYPSAFPQLSATFSALWPLMVRDFMMYRRFDSEKEFKELRSAVRSMHMALAEYVSDRDLLENLPGWSFVDWLKEWNIGVPPPGESAACSAIFSLHYLLSLKAAIELEEYIPENGGGLKSYYQNMYDRVAESVLKHFWNEEESLFADDLAGTRFSMHAQCLAILSGVIAREKQKRCFEAMLKKENIAFPTLYFIFYLFETFKVVGEGGKILDYAYIWKDMLDKGAVTTWEKPEPTRSDCHAWGAHLYYHYFASLAGIRPAVPGFREVTVMPAFGELKHISGNMPHPDGVISFDFRKESDHTVSGHITLPGEVGGSFTFGGKTKRLYPGENKL